MIYNNSSYKDNEIDKTTYLCKLKLIGKYNDNRYLFHMTPDNIMTCIFLDQRAMINEYMACPNGMFLVQFFKKNNKKYSYHSKNSEAVTIASIKLIADFPENIKDVKSLSEELKTRLSKVYEVELCNRSIKIRRK